jgi:radical SAM-linked protein
MIPKQWFIEDWQRALELKHAEDCRHSKCHRCGVIDEERELCASMLRTSIEGKKSEKDFERSETPLLSEPARPKMPPKRIHDADPVQRLLFRVAITGEARFLSHLETKNAWVRTLRRGRIPIAYSKGFNPQPKLSFESARPTAEESLGSYMDIYLKNKENPQEILARLKGLVAPGFSVLSVKEIPFSASSLMGAVAGMDYIFYVPKIENNLESKAEEILAKEEILIERKRKVKKRKANSYNKGRWKKEDPMRTIDVRPNIKEIKFSVPNDLQKEGYQAIAVGLDRVEQRGLRPSEFLTLLGFKHEECHVLRLRTRFLEPVLS